MTDLHVDRHGSGPSVVLVHGSVLGGYFTWPGQLPLAERFELIVPDRRGFGKSPGDRADWERDAQDIAELLGDGAHLVGLSYGGVGSLLAAAARPEAVRSLTVIEPPASSAVASNPDVIAWRERVEEIRDDPDLTARDRLAAFLDAIGVDVPLPDPLPEPLERGVALMRTDRSPAEAQIPMDALAATPFPKLVVSGGHMAAWEAICDGLAEGIGAEREIIRGNGHEVQRLGEPVNEVLEAIFIAGEAARAGLPA